ncbi:MAG: hypothetical protein ABIG20_02535 [archaeon]
MDQIDKIESEIINDFTVAASLFGYSEVHGRILAALLVEGGDLSLEDLAKKTSYSTSMISLSLDLLAVIGMITKVKKPGDRKLYVSLQGEILPALKIAIVLKIQQGVVKGRANFEEYRKEVRMLKDSKKKKVLVTLDKLDHELERIEKYINRLAEVELPE